MSSKIAEQKLQHRVRSIIAKFRLPAVIEKNVLAGGGVSGRRIQGMTPGQSTTYRLMQKIYAKYDTENRR